MQQYTSQYRGTCIVELGQGASENTATARTTESHTAYHIAIHKHTLTGTDTANDLCLRCTSVRGVRLRVVVPHQAHLVVGTSYGGVYDDISTSPS